jgi:hypothetical protein
MAAPVLLLLKGKQDCGFGLDPDPGKIQEKEENVKKFTFYEKNYSLNFSFTAHIGTGTVRYRCGTGIYRFYLFFHFLTFNSGFDFLKF